MKIYPLIFFVIFSFSVTAFTIPDVGEGRCVPAPGMPCDLPELKVGECTHKVVDCAATCAHLPLNTKTGTLRHTCTWDCIQEADARRTAFVQCYSKQSGEAAQLADAAWEEAATDCPQYFDITPCLASCRSDDLEKNEKCSNECFIKQDTAGAANSKCIDQKLNTFTPQKTVDTQPKEEPITSDAPVVGTAAIVRGNVEVQDSDGTWKLVAHDRPIKFGDHIRTSEKSKILLILADNTQFTVGPESDFVIDEFVYDPNQTAAKVTASIAKGFFRWVTGKVARKAPTQLNLRVPVGTIGIRGTDFIVKLEEKITTIHVNEGIVTYTPDTTKKLQEIRAGNTAVITGGKTEIKPLDQTAWNALVNDITPTQTPTAGQWAIIVAVWIVLLVIVYYGCKGIIKAIKWVFKKK